MKLPSTSLLLGCLLLCMATENATAATVSISASTDASLFERNPNNNFGGNADFPVGTTRNGERSRGLVEFRPELGIPAGATILSATLHINVNKAPTIPASSTYEIRKVLMDWEEGNKTGLTGQAATDNEVTWNHRITPLTGWSSAGSIVGIDFSATASSTLSMGVLGPQSFVSTPQTVADVQAWLDEPSSNHGWVIMTRSEGTASTARRITSSEAASQGPILEIEYSLPLEITSSSIVDQDILITWSEGAPPYQLQRTESLAPLAWMNEGTTTTDTSARVPLGTGHQFFRVVEDFEASYTLTFQSAWSPSTHPDQYPGGAHWSGLVGGLHNGNVTFWKVGELASTGVKNVAEVGSKTAMLSEVNAAITAGTAGSTLSGSGNSGTGSVQLTFTANRAFPLATVITMIAPSPDWFAGVSGLELIDENGQWKDEVVVSLDLFDSGTDDGTTYTSANSVSSPPVQIFQRTGFPALVDSELVSFGSFTFSRNE